MIELDYHQHQCPYPVVETRKQLLAQPQEQFSVLVGDDAARENVSRLAEKLGFAVAVETVGENFRLQLTPGAAAQSQADTKVAAEGETVVFCTSEQLGQGDEEFGRILMKNFLITLLDVEPQPDRILFINSGVKLACAGSEALEALNTLACRGVDIASCGLCLDFYQLKEQLAVGRVTNMLEIVESQLQAARVIRP